MFRIPDIWKIYGFILLGMCMGYLGAYDSKNFLILGIPTFLLLNNTNFSCYTEKIKYERMRSFNSVLQFVRDCIEIFRAYSGNTDEVKEKLHESLRTLFAGMDLQSLVSTGLISMMTS